MAMQRRLTQGPAPRSAQELTVLGGEVKRKGGAREVWLRSFDFDE